MTRSEIERLDFTAASVSAWAPRNQRNSNWPVVYVLDDARSDRDTAQGALDNVYVGETLNAAARMRQHLASPEKNMLRTIRVIIDETFNKSACLDLESYLIRLFAGDGSYRVLNRNDGITDADYFDRTRYSDTFREVFDELLREGVFTRSIPEIENSDLFKLSPYKALSHDQAVAVEQILEGLFADLRSGAASTTVIQGDPGTGKTVIGIYLMKLLVDIAAATPADEVDRDTRFSEFFVAGYPELIRGLRIGLVVPQQSLRTSIRKVFRKTPGLSADMVMTPFDAGAIDEKFDLLIVDEAHRLSQRANQPSAAQNKRFREITEKLFGRDDTTRTQVDWIQAVSRHQIFLLDAMQSVRPADVTPALLGELVRGSQRAHRYYPLVSQMRVRAGSDYVGYIRSLFRTVSGAGLLGSAAPETIAGYDFRLFDSVAEMRDEIHRKDAEYGLARLVAGYAWEWKSRRDKTAFDIEIDGNRFRWNGTQVDWIASQNSLNEVGSIHTVQGYDLNYAGVIVGNELRYDPLAKRLFIDRASYFDTKGKENNRALGESYTDDDLLRFITNIYAVLLTRGIRGTYVYVCDPALRAYLRQYIPGA